MSSKQESRTYSITLSKPGVRCHPKGGYVFTPRLSGQLSTASQAHWSEAAATAQEAIDYWEAQLSKSESRRISKHNTYTKDINLDDFYRTIVNDLTASLESTRREEKRQAKFLEHIKDKLVAVGARVKEAADTRAASSVLWTYVDDDNEDVGPASTVEVDWGGGGAVINVDSIASICSQWCETVYT